jgi:hypothetical protein
MPQIIAAADAPIASAAFLEAWPNPVEVIAKPPLFFGSILWKRRDDSSIGVTLLRFRDTSVVE